MNGPAWMDVLTYLQRKTAWAFNGFLFVKRKNEKIMKGKYKLHHYHHQLMLFVSFI